MLPSTLHRNGLCSTTNSVTIWGFDHTPRASTDRVYCADIVRKQPEYENPAPVLLDGAGRTVDRAAYRAGVMCRLCRHRPAVCGCGPTLPRRRKKRPDDGPQGWRRCGALRMKKVVPYWFSSLRTAPAICSALMPAAFMSSSGEPEPGIPLTARC